MTHAQAANRVNFNQPEEEFLDGDDVVGLGVLGKEGSGQLRAQVTLKSALLLSANHLAALLRDNFPPRALSKLYGLPWAMALKAAHTAMLGFWKNNKKNI